MNGSKGSRTGRAGSQAKMWSQIKTHWQLTSPDPTEELQDVSYTSQVSRPTRGTPMLVRVVPWGGEKNKSPGLATESKLHQTHWHIQTVKRKMRNLAKAQTLSAKVCNSRAGSQPPAYPWKSSPGRGGASIIWPSDRWCIPIRSKKTEVRILYWNWSVTWELSIFRFHKGNEHVVKEAGWYGQRTYDFAQGWGVLPHICPIAWLCDSGQITELCESQFS